MQQEKIGQIDISKAPLLMSLLYIILCRCRCAYFVELFSIAIFLENHYGIAIGKNN